MRKGYKISKKGWVIIGILVVIILLSVFVMSRKSVDRNAFPTNDQNNKTENISSNAEIQKRLTDTKLAPEEKKKLEEQLKKGVAKEGEVDPRSASVAPNWLTSLKGLFSEYGVQFMAFVVSLVGVILALSGFSFSGKKKQKFLKKYFHEIDDAYSTFKMKDKRCEAELYRLQDLIEHELKEGKINETTFQLLEKRIERYLKEIKSQEKV